MKIPELLAPIKERLAEIREHELDNIKEAREIGCSNTFGAGMASGSLATLNDVEPDLAKLIRAVECLSEGLEMVEEVIRITPPGQIARTALAQAEEILK